MKDRGQSIRNLVEEEERTTVESKMVMQFGAKSRDLKKRLWNLVEW